MSTPQGHPSQKQKLPPLTAEEAEIMKISEADRKLVVETIILARLYLVVNKPFFGALATRLVVIENSTWCKTLATDGKHFYYNPRFILGYNEEQKKIIKKRLLNMDGEPVSDELFDAYTRGLSTNNMIAGFAHEIMHCAYDHFTRRSNRDPHLFNIAADYAINQLIHREQIGEIGEGWLFDPKYDGMFAEEIYELLLEDEENQKNKDSIDEHMYGGSGSSDGESGSRGSVSDYLCSNGDDEDDVNGTGEGKGERPVISQDEMESNMADFKDAMISAAKHAGMDKVPPGLRGMLQSFTEPKIDWRTKLDKTLRSHIRDDATYMVPSRRSGMGGIIFPGLKPAEKIDICVAIDTSGSISEKMIKDFLSEVYGMTKQFQQFKIKLLCFDTACHNPKDFDENNISQLFQYELGGGGGTDFEVVWDYMKAENYVPNQIVMFTDGYPWSSWGDKDYAKTLFVIHGTDSIVAPFGATIYYDE